MRRFLLVLVMAFFVLGISAQEKKKEVRYHLISLEDKKDAAMYYRFYIENVYDGRQFKENIGTVQKGAFNNKILANFKKPFDQEIKDYLLILMPKHEASKPVSLRISDLYVSELTEAFSETGYASVVADVIVTIDGRQYIAGTVSATIESGGMDVTGQHDERIKKALQKCIAQFGLIPAKELTKIPFDPNEHMVKRQAGKASKGVYISYTDMLRNTPSEDADYTLEQEGDKYYIVSSLTGNKMENYYGYSDGETVYLNVSKYATQKYYAKTEVIGGKYFIENVVYNSNNRAMMSAMFGIIGALATSGDGDVPMLLDGNSGQPFFLSNSEVKTLLEPYPDLLQEYKKSKRKNADVKNILIKYYALQQ